MPWELQQKIKETARKAKDKVEEELVLKQVDDFLLDWMQAAPLDEFADTLRERRAVELTEEFKRDVWRRTPWWQHGAIYHAATPERIRSYIVRRTPVIAPEYWAVIQQTDGVDYLTKRALAAIKELFN